MEDVAKAQKHFYLHNFRMWLKTATCPRLYDVIGTAVQVDDITNIAFWIRELIAILQFDRNVMDEQKVQHKWTVIDVWFQLFDYIVM